MIVDLEIVKQNKELQSIPDERLKRKLRAIEKAIRSYTNNNFMNRDFRVYGQIKDNAIYANTKFFNAGDNIQISHSLNNDVYTIKSVVEGKIEIDCNNLYNCDNVMLTKVEYPEDVQEGVINMLIWDATKRNKVGIKSETLSRHRVDYFDMDSGNALKGYPSSLLGFLDDYVKARF